MPDYRLLFTDLDATSTNYGAPMVLSPGTASGVPIPAMQVGNTLPAAGTQVGQAFYLLGARQGYAWTGSNWQPLSSTPLVTYTTEAGLLAATGDTPGTYATAGDTGNLFVRQASGWRQLGVRTYNTVAGLLADTPAVGSLGEALDEGSLWERLATGWRCLVVRELADTAAVLAWTAGAATGGAVGDRALDLAHDVLYVRTTNGWLPTTAWADTEANIRAATWPVKGQTAIATDTGRTFTRLTGSWLEEPIAHFATEALLLASTPQPGVLAWSDDTNEVFVRVAGTPAGPGGTPAAGPATWKRFKAPQVTVSRAAPSTPAKTDLWFDQNTDDLKVYDGTAWVDASTPHWGATVTMGANAGMVGNQVILLKGVTPTNDGVYISVVDTQTGHSGGRAGYALHVFATDSTSHAGAQMLHLEADNSRFSSLHWFWKDATDSYVLAATISEACAGAVYRIGAMSPTADLHNIKADGNTLTTDTTSGMVVDVTSSSGVGGLSTTAFDDAVKAAAARVFPSVSTPTQFDAGASGTVDQFSWQPAKGGTHHRWSFVAGTNPVTPALYANTEAPNGTNKRWLREGMLHQIDGTFDVVHDDTTASAGGMWILDLHYGDDDNRVKAGTHCYIDVNWLESPKSDAQIMEYTMKYTRHTDSKRAILFMRYFAYDFAAHPVVGYAINAYAGASWTECKIY